jgi:hypothetical protein
MRKPATAPPADQSAPPAAVTPAFIALSADGPNNCRVTVTGLPPAAAIAVIAAITARLIRLRTPVETAGTQAK